MIRLLPTLAALAGAALATGLQASNFSYSYLGLDIAVTDFDESLYFGNTEYRGVVGASLAGAYQFDESIAIWLSSTSQSAEGEYTEISYTETLIGLAVPLPVADRLDLTPLLGQGVLQAEACDGAICAQEDQTTLFWGLQARAWLAPDAVEANATWINPVDEDLDASLSLGLALWPDDHNSIRLRFANGDAETSYAFGYRYTW